MKYFVGIISLLICLQSYSQDVIYKRDGNKIEAKILSVSAIKVVYKKFQNLEGAAYTLLVSAISTIVYQNGDHEIFDSLNIDKQAVVKAADDKNETSYKRNIITTNYLDLFSRRLSLSYEYLFSGGFVAVRIPVAITWDKGLNSDVNFGNYTRFKTGLDINFYPTGQQRLSYLVGPSIRVRNEVDTDFLWLTGSGEEFTSVGAYINNGGVFQIGEKMNISIVAGLGLKSKSTTSNDANQAASVLDVFIEGNMGIRF